MSRVYEALRQMEKDQGISETSSLPESIGLLGDSESQNPELSGTRSIKLSVSPKSRLVALSQPRSLGAEKFRVLVTRLENLRRQKEIKSLQITSSVINEGKTLVAANLAVSFAKRTNTKVLLFEGDLHRPTLSDLLGLSDVKGLNHWWADKNMDVTECLCQLDKMPLWFLSAGGRHEQPSQMLQSARFADAFSRLAEPFDWVIVDSTPMLPIADVNLWSRLVDGTLLVVREGVASRNVLKKGIESLDNLKLVGTILNEALEPDHAEYSGQYYGVECDKK